MTDLAYFCHICQKIVYIGERVECPYCKEAFLEVYEESDPSEEEEYMSRYGLFDLLRCRRTPAAKKQKTITSDRRNYAIGPELHDIITRLRDEMGVEENPATKAQKEKLAFVELAENEVCSICFGSFSMTEKGCRYPCSHSFHQSCSDAWLKLQSDCPLCRAPL